MALPGATFHTARIAKVFAIFAVIFSQCGFRDARAAMLKTIAPNDLEAVAKTNEHLLVVFVSKDCTSCKDAERELSTLTSRDNVDLQVTVVRIVDSDIPKKMYGHASKTEPTIVFYRHRNPLVYYGKIETTSVDDWITYNHESALKILSDDDFEHLTQVGTGATTGDWLVIFCDVNDESCLHFQHVYEGVAAKLKWRHNVAFVDTSKNTNIVERFSIVKPRTIIFFRLGKMYEYSIDNIDVGSLSGFAVSFYKNVKSVNVPVHLSPFDLFTVKIAQSIRENNSYFWAFVAFAAIVTFAIVYVMLRSGYRPTDVSKKQ